LPIFFSYFLSCIYAWFLLYVQSHSTGFTVHIVRLYFQLFVGGLVSYLRYLCLSAHSGIQNILCCFLFVFPIFEGLWFLLWCSSLRKCYGRHCLLYSFWLSIWFWYRHIFLSTQKSKYKLQARQQQSRNIDYNVIGYVWANSLWEIA
jgi:hypothetical protein